MKEFKADLHIHTVLSPCGDFGMTPRGIVDQALKKNLQIIGITDHNTTRHCRLIMELGEAKGIFVLPGAEINSREEVHCLTLFENIESLESFQVYIDRFLVVIPHNHEKLGDQVVVDKYEMIVAKEQKSLYSIVDQSLEEISQKVHSLGGIFIPAHINRPRNSLLSQLGFIPEGLLFEALELLPGVGLLHIEEDKTTKFIQCSDAHFLEDIGRRISIFRMEELTYREILLALAHKKNREVILG